MNAEASSAYFAPELLELGFQAKRRVWHRRLWGDLALPLAEHSIPD
jgi:hypothetical protein